MAFLLASGNAPFLAAAAFVGLMAVVEAALLALGLSSDALFGKDHDAGMADAVHHQAGDGHAHAEGVLSWLGFGRVPLVVVLVSLGATYAVSGFVIQAVVASLSGAVLPWFFSAPLALLPALPLTRLATTAIARLVPREETYVATRASLVGRVGVIVQGQATAALAAEARVPDGHGGSIYVRVFPAEAADSIPQGTRIALVARSGEDAFVAVPLPEEEAGLLRPG